MFNGFNSEPIDGKPHNQGYYCVFTSVWGERRGDYVYTMDCSLLFHCTSRTKETIEFKVYGPKGTKIHEHLNETEYKKILQKICEDSQMQLSAMRNAEKTEKARSDLNKQREVETKKVLVKPDVPIMAMTMKQLEGWFPRFLESVYLANGKRIIQKWAKQAPEGEEEGKFPPVPECPYWNPGIIKPGYLYGMGKTYFEGSLRWRTQCQVYWIMLKMEYDPETYCESIPDDYVKLNIPLEKLEEMANNIKLKPRVRKNSKIAQRKDVAKTGVDKIAEIEEVDKTDEREDDWSQNVSFEKGPGETPYIEVEVTTTAGEGRHSVDTETVEEVKDTATVEEVKDTSKETQVTAQLTA